jgi:hypothetical protein
MKNPYKNSFWLVAALILALNTAAQTVPPLINYQGRLTAQTGASLAPAAYTLQFKLWDDPLLTNQTDLIWGQQQNVTIQSNGVFNVILGSPGGSPIPGATPAVNSLAYAFAGSNCFFGVTVAVSNGVPIPAPTEILPRQQLLAVPFAVRADAADVAASVLPGSIVTASLAQGAVQASNIAPGAVQTANIALNSVTWANLASRPIGTNVGVGGVAISVSCGTYPPTYANLVVQIVTSGRPVYVGLISDQSAVQTGDCSFIDVGSGGGNAGTTTMSFVRDQTVIATANAIIGINADGTADNTVVMPPGSFNTIDLPAAGTHTYSVTVAGQGYVCRTQLAVFEL